MTQIGINGQMRFSADTPAVADDVNANFDVFKTAHNDTDTRVITLENNITNYLDKTISNTFPLVQKYKSTTITGATNATPIVITSVAHGRSTGDKIYNENVGGNTNANGVFSITKLTDDTYSLDNSVGNAAYTSGGTSYLLPKNLEDLANKAFVLTSGKEIKSLGSIAASFTLSSGKSKGNITDNISISLPTTGLISGIETKCEFDFSLLSGKTLTIPTSTNIIWKGTKPTAYSTITTGNEEKARNTLIFTTKDGGTNWVAEYFNAGGIEIAFTQPVLNANGTLGGSTFAVYTSAVYGAGVYAYAFSDGNDGSTCYGPDYATPYDILYNPIPLKVPNIYVNSNIGGYTVYGSNDNSTYTTLTSGAFTSGGANTISIPAINQGFYNYYKIQPTSRLSGNYITVMTITLLNGVYIAT